MILLSKVFSSLSLSHIFNFFGTSTKEQAECFVIYHSSNTISPSFHSYKSNLETILMPSWLSTNSMMSVSSPICIPTIICSIWIDISHREQKSKSNSIIFNLHFLSCFQATITVHFADLLTSYEKTSISTPATPVTKQTISTTVLPQDVISTHQTKKYSLLKEPETHKKANTMTHDDLWT